MLSRAFWTVGEGRGEIREAALSAPGPGRCLVRAVASGVSRGTEALVFAGRVPASQHEAMRAPMMDGQFPFPVKYGYSLAGFTDDGRRVFALHPHQDRCVIPIDQCIPLPDDLPFERAVLAANVETALNIVWDARPLPGQRVAVIGAGVVGLAVASILARIPLTIVTLADILARRETLATRLGCAFVTPDRMPAGHDLVIHTSGSQAGLSTALGCAGDEARIVEASWFGDRAPIVPLGEAFHSKRLTLVSSQVGRIAPGMRSRRTHRERLSLALELLRDAVYDGLLEPSTPFNDLPEAMPRLLADGLCHVITYETPSCTA